jgi:predicted nucleotide-binding protein
VTSETPNGNGSGVVLKLSTGALVNVFHTGTCNVQRRNRDAAAAALSDLVGSGRSSKSGGRQSNEIFVVYGRDRNTRNELEAFLRRVGLEPLILEHLPTEGATIIEQLEKYQRNVPAAVVLITPDDEGYIAGEPDKVKPRARRTSSWSWGWYW